MLDATALRNIWFLARILCPSWSKNHMFEALDDSKHFLDILTTFILLTLSGQDFSNFCYAPQKLLGRPCGDFGEIANVKIGFAPEPGAAAFRDLKWPTLAPAKGASRNIGRSLLLRARLDLPQLNFG